MKTASVELLDVIKRTNHNFLDVKSVVIGLSFDYPEFDTPDYILSNPNKSWEDEPMFDRVITLKEHWKLDDWHNMLEGLRFNYDSGFGSQHLFGVVWFKDGSWLERYEYDGAEKWVLKKVPIIPRKLKGV